jgi:hypothetical protein
MGFGVRIGKDEKECRFILCAKAALRCFKRYFMDQNPRLSTAFWGAAQPDPGIIGDIHGASALAPWISLYVPADCTQTPIGPYSSTLYRGNRLQ